MAVYWNSHPTALALLPAAAIGCVVNWTIFYSFQKVSSLKHSFGLLSANQALADAFHGSMFLFYFCPMVIFDSNTKIVIMGIWVFTLSSSIYLYQYLCKVYFDEASQFLTFTNSELCGNIAWYADFVRNSSLVIIIVLIDLFTVIRVRQVSRRVITSISEAQNQRISKREMRFLKQTVFQGAVFLLELLTYFLFPKYFENQWIVFFGTSFAWVSVHAADGIVVMICNPDVRKFVFSRGQLLHIDSTTQFSQKSH